MEYIDAISILKSEMRDKTGSTRDAYNLAIITLEKQIEREPIPFRDGKKIVFVCPRCFDNDFLSEIKAGQYYCECGQKIKM